ncbi:MAG: ATP-binding cassette domain-containing protein [Epsilonproteobacteria bacterium]|nr:ATP-binding cassette domain-containing protein [Campylobacterota bacterium]
MIIENGSFSVNSGDFVFLTGPSGSGKTTIIKHLYGELKAKRGYLNIGGFDMRKISRSKLTYLRRYIGIVFQDYKLIKEWNIEKNVKLPLMIAGVSEDVQQKKVLKLLSKVKLAHKADKFPYELSGGEQQRAAVIRAIINEPVLILADEPTGNLDDYSAKLVMDLFRFANELGITILIATHHLPQTFEVPYRHLHIENKKLYEVS